MSGEPSSALTYLSAERYRQVEAATDELCRTHPVDDTLVLAGEVDASNQSALLAALLCASAAADAGPLRLDCRELGFVGVGGWRALQQGTERLRAAGGLVVLLRPPPVVARTLEMLGLGDGVSIVPALYEPS
jgi:anti-anti-sigma factor